jgi:quercetin dioxygenase-like cupin family protein
MYKTSQAELTPEGAPGASGRRAWWAISAERGAATNGVLGLGASDANVASGLHRHRNAEEAMIVLGGNGAVLTPDAEHPASEGTLVYAPRGSWHGLRAGDQGLRILMIYGGPTSPRDIDYDNADGVFTDGAAHAVCLNLWDADEVEANDPAQGFHHISARWLVDDGHLGSASFVVGQSGFDALTGVHDLHRHPSGEEFLYLLSGSGLHIDQDGAEIPVQAGDITFVPANEWHGFRNPGDEKALAIFGYFGATSLAAAGYELPSTA